MAVERYPRGLRTRSPGNQPEQRGRWLQGPPSTRLQRIAIEPPAPLLSGCEQHGGGSAERSRIWRASRTVVSVGLGAFGPSTSSTASFPTAVHHQDDGASSQRLCSRPGMPLPTGTSSAAPGSSDPIVCQAFPCPVWPCSSQLDRVANPFPADPHAAVSSSASLQ